MTEKLTEEQLESIEGKRMERHLKNHGGGNYKEDCKACPNTWCLTNITSLEVFKRLEQGDEEGITHYGCDDFVEDTNLPRDLRTRD